MKPALFTDVAHCMSCSVMMVEVVATKIGNQPDNPPHDQKSKDFTVNTLTTYNLTYQLDRMDLIRDLGKSWIADSQAEVEACFLWREEKRFGRGKTSYSCKVGRKEGVGSWPCAIEVGQPQGWSC